MKTSTLIAAAAILALAATPVFGAGEEEGTSAGPPSMQIYANYWDRNPSWSPETFVVRKFAEIAGADLELVTGDAQKLKTLVASGDLPDTMWGGFNRLEAMDFGVRGALYPIDTLFDMMPNLAVWRDRYPEYDGAMTAPDGHQYSTASVVEFTQLRRAPSISPRVRDLGVDPHADIQTMQDLLSVLGRFKAEWPENFPWVTRRGIRDGYHVMFGTNHSIYLNPQTDRWTYGELEENYRGMIDILRQAWADGLMHPDFMSMTEDPWREIMSQDKAYFTTGPYSQISWQATDRADPDTWWIPILAPEFDGTRYWSTIQNPRVLDNSLWHLSAGTEVAEHAARLIDWLYGDEGVYYIYFGEVGVTSELDDLGYGYYEHFPEGERVAWMWEQGFHFFRYNVVHSLWELNPSKAGSAAEKVFTDEVADFYIGNDSVRPPEPVLTFTQDELDRIKQIRADADAFALEGAAGFIRGSRPMSEWGDFVSRLERIGVKELEAIHNAAYERLKELL